MTGDRMGKRLMAGEKGKRLPEVGLYRCYEVVNLIFIFIFIFILFLSYLILSQAVLHPG